MKKPSKILVAIGVLLIIWGTVDFYNCATTGKEVLQYYDGAELIKKLVNYNFIQGLLKTVFGILVVAISFFAKKKG